MVDFKKLRNQSDKKVPIDPLEIFRRLPKVNSDINDLWNGQAEALKEWTTRRNEKDIVIKLNTGGGKTLVGLLILQSIMNETKGRTIFMCPDNQLVDQTYEKAIEYGIEVTKYVSGKGVPDDFKNGEKILIANYNSLFNGQSKFGIRGDIDIVHVEGILIDDAHSAFSEVRDTFTLSIDSKKHEVLYSEIVSLFRRDFERIGKQGTFDDIVEGRDYSVLEVPYWSWKSKASEIRNILAQTANKNFPFHWPLLRDEFDTCHVLISDREISITPLYPLVDLFPTFSECPRRIYMSATIADDSSIISTFDADKSSVETPIVPKSLAGVGERMILAPALINFKEKQDTFELTKKLAKWVSGKDESVVILTPSDKIAEKWTDIAQFPKGSKEVQDKVTLLTTCKSKGPFVFSNRYNGIDLPGKSCTFLVMSHLPRGTSIYDRFRAVVLEGSKAVANGIAQSVEQGLGRGTRGAGDHCVIILEGSDLINWVSQKENLDLLTVSTNVQLNMGIDISRSIEGRKDLAATVLQSLERHTDWVQYHAEELAEKTDEKHVDLLSVEIAAAERKYLQLYRDGYFEKAISTLERVVGNKGVDNKQKGWLKQLIARAFWYWGAEDNANREQQYAYSENRQLLRPIVEPPYKPVIELENQVDKIISNLSRYQIRRGFATYFEDVVSKLVRESSSNQFEESMKELGTIMGFYAERPEKETGKGPDVLWLSEDYGFVIECKSRKKSTNPLTKDEHGQLLTAVEWFKIHYPNKRVCKVIVHPNHHSTKNASVVDTMAFTLDKLSLMITSVRELVNELSNSSAHETVLQERVSRMLLENSLSPESIVKSHLVPFAIE